MHIVAELAPFARSGGLGEAVNSLARFQAASGIPTSIVMPLYDAVKANAPDIEPVGPSFRVQVGPRIGGGSTVAARRRRPIIRSRATSVYFIESEEYFARPHIYGPPGADYLDNGRRYACFTAAALECAADDCRLASRCCVHAHDWHTALAPVYLRTTFAPATSASAA